MDKLQSLGYEIEVDARTGAPEIKGFSKEYLQESSPRREEVLNEAQEIKERLEREGATVKEGAGLNQAAAHANRASKRYDHAQMRHRALEMDARYGSQAALAVEQARKRVGLELSQDQIQKRAREAVTFARDNAMEREAVADIRKITADALRRNLGLTTYGAVMTELRQRVERGEFIEVMRQQGPRQATTRRMVEMEESNLQRVLTKSPTTSQILVHQNLSTIDAVAEHRQLRLNEDQRTALEQILTCRDQIFGLQGGAGTGKTTVLSVLREVAEKEGYEVRGFAPTTRATKQLAESGIKSETLQKFIRRRGEAPANHNRLFVLDDSSLASTRNLHKFFSRLEAQDKVLLVGDSRQHQAVEAGTPFEQFQKHGMTTVRLSEIVRQRKPDLKRTVEKLSGREIRQAIDSLERQGRIIEIADPKDRLRCIASAYCESPDNTLVVSPRNRERVELNSLIHRQLQQDRRIDQTDHQMTVYVNHQDMTGTERPFANAYRPGEDIIRYNRASKVYGVKVGDYALVTAKNHAENEITVRFDNRATAHLQPAAPFRRERLLREPSRIGRRRPHSIPRAVNRKARC